MKKLNRQHVRRLLSDIILEASEKENKSELNEFSMSKSGKRVSKVGSSLIKNANIIYEIAADQTGAMARTLEKLAEFVDKMGGSLSVIGGGNDMLTENEGSTMSESLPTVNELKTLIKAIKKLENK